MREYPKSIPLTLSVRLTVLCLAIGSVFCGVAEARLGDTPKQCIKRYGTPTGDTDVPGLIPNGTIFQRGEYSITCGFENNQCVVVVVLRNVPDSPDIRKIPRNDISLFMQENFGRLSWNFTKFSSLESVWRTRNWNEHISYEASFAPSLQMLILKQL